MGRFLKIPQMLKTRRVRKRKKFLRYKFDLHGLSIEKQPKKFQKLLKIVTTKVFQKYYSSLVRTPLELRKNVYVSKNHSTLKGTIPEFIKNTSSLYSKITKMNNALPREGGKGALVIRLKKFKV